MQLGKGCKYVLNVNGERIEFYSEMELDSYLSTNVDRWKIDKMNKIFSIDSQEITINRIKDISNDIHKLEKKIIRHGDDPESYEEYYAIKDSIGVNKFLSLKGNPDDFNKPLILPFKKDPYFEHKKKFWQENGYSVEQVIQMAKDEEESWEGLTDIGTEIHAILEDYIKGTNNAKTEILDREGLTDSVKNNAKTLIDTIKMKHGNDCELFSELGIISKKLNPDIAELLKASGYNSINGKIDLLVVDKEGVAHIYDFKVSRKNIGDWNDTTNPEIGTPESKDVWTSLKKLGITYQLGTYTAILRQHGVQVGSANICPIKLNISYTDDSKTNIKSFDSVEFQEVFANVPGTRAGAKYNKILNIIPPITEITSEETLKIFNALNVIAPNTDIQTKIERKHGDVTFYKEHPQTINLSKLTKDNPHYGEYKWKFERKGTDGKWSYAKDDADLDVKLSDYVMDLTARRASETRDIADNIAEAIEIGDWEHIGANYKGDQQNFLQNQFKKYVVHRWTFEKNENLNSAGIFIFKKAGRTEFVLLSNKPLLQKLNLGLGHSLLGKTLSDANVSRKEILDATYGHLELMKAMIYISQNQDLFVDDKISEIRCINPWSAENRMVCQLSSVLYNNYNLIYLQNRDSGKLKEIRSDIFWDDVTSLIATAYDLETIEGEGWIDFQLQIDARKATYDAEWLKQQIDRLKAKYTKLYNIENYTNDDIWNAYVYLQRAYNACMGIYTVSESSPGDIFGQGGIFELNGNLISSAQFSPSANIQKFAEVHDQYVAEVRQTIQQRGQKMIKYFNDFYEEAGRIKALGGERDLFKSWFVLDEKGQIDSSFRLKNPMSSEFDGAPAARKAMIEFLDVMWKLKHPKASEDELAYDKNQALSGNPDYDEYFEVPLTQGKFTQQAKGLGFFKAIKNKALESMQLTKDMFAEDENRKNQPTDIREAFKREHNTVYNKFALTSTQRKQKIEDHKVGFFETNIELIFNEALQQYTRQEISAKYVPIFQAMRLTLQFQRTHNKESNDSVLETFDKLLKSKFYGETLIKEDAQPLYRWLNLIKKGFTTLTLGLNFTSFFRELLAGTYTGFSRSGVELIEGIDAKTYVKGASHVIKDAYKNFSGVSLMNQLNQQYGMANMSLSSIANQRRTNWFAIRNWGKDTMFLTSSSPDFQHRMSILVAKMMGDGSWEAHSLDADGFLKYNWKKDKRFAAYVAGDTSHKDYLYQKTLYLKYIEEYNRIGYKKADGTEYKEGDDLPQAYPPREGQRLKNFADLLYGHYDDESRSLINDTFVGAFFMQYKTFVTAKIEQWMNKPGIYNTEHLKQQYDPVTNERLYVKYTYPTPDQKGIPKKDILRESQLTEEDKQSELVESYLRWEGDPMEGMFHSTWSVLKTLKDPTEFKRIMQDPLKKAQFILSVNDLAIMGIISLILTALFANITGEEEWWNSKKVFAAAKKDGPFSDFSYKIFWGATQDSNIINVLGTMFSDMNPPMFTSATRFADAVGSVITGNKGIAEAMCSQVGAFKPMQGVIREWEQK